MLVIGLLPVILPGCESHKGEARFWENEREKIELGQRLELARYRLDRHAPGELPELESLNRLLKESDVSLRDLRQDQSTLTVEIEEMERRNDDISRLALQSQRSRAQGMKFDSLPTRDGRTFRNVSISGVDDSGVSVRHEHGAARLRYAELSDEQRLFFGLEETTALAAEDREHEEALAYERGIDLELDAIREREREERKKLIANTNKAPQVSSSQMAASSYQHAARPLAQPARSFGSGSSYRRWYGYSGYRYYRPTYYYVYRQPSVPNPFCSSARAYRHSPAYTAPVRGPSTPSNP